MSGMQKVDQRDREMCSIQVVDCSKALKVWAGAPGGMLTYHDLISVDADVIQVPDSDTT